MPTNPEEITALGLCYGCHETWEGCGFSPRIPMPHSPLRWCCFFCVKFLLSEMLLRIAQEHPTSELAQKIVEIHGGLAPLPQVIRPERKKPTTQVITQPQPTPDVLPKPKRPKPKVGKVKQERPCAAGCGQLTASASGFCSRTCSREKVEITAPRNRVGIRRLRDVATRRSKKQGKK